MMIYITHWFDTQKPRDYSRGFRSPYDYFAVAGRTRRMRLMWFFGGLISS
ncbi:MAG: hypothetical protein U0451_02890 [Candidatus Saccharimonadales bacterium]